MPSISRRMYKASMQVHFTWINLGPMQTSESQLKARAGILKNNITTKRLSRKGLLATSRHRWVIRVHATEGLLSVKHARPHMLAVITVKQLTQLVRRLTIVWSCSIRMSIELLQLITIGLTWQGQTSAPLSMLITAHWILEVHPLARTNCQPFRSSQRRRA